MDNQKIGSFDLETRLRELGVTQDLRAEKREVHGITWDVLISEYEGTTLCFAHVANGYRLFGFVTRVLRCQKCKELVFSKAIDTVDDLKLQAVQQATNNSQPGNSHYCPHA